MNLLCFDLETYGACRLTRRSTALPQQTVFHPQRSLGTDLVNPRDLVLSCCITPVVVPDLSSDQWQCPLPGKTQLLLLDDPGDIWILRSWFEWADALLGMNILFDLTYTRAFDPFLRASLNGRHLLMDLAVFNYLHSELRPERSLKALGTVLGTHKYEETLKTVGRFQSPDCPRFQRYAVADPHNTLLDVHELTKRIRADFPNSDKIRGPSLRWFSRVLHTCLHMQEAGVPLSCSTLETYHNTLLEQADALSAQSPVPLRGKDSQTLQAPLYDAAVAACPGILDNPLTKLTPKKRTFSRSDGNRSLLLSLLPDSHPSRPGLELLQRDAKLQKLLSSYTYPLLFHKRNDPASRGSVAIEHHKGDRDTHGGSRRRVDLQRPLGLRGPDVRWRRCFTQVGAAEGILYPTWYPVPLEFDNASQEGGTIQGRITAKNPAVQTFPDAILRHIRSRFPGGYVLVGDLSQIELRVAALLSGDESLVRNYIEGRDLHTDYTLEIFGEAIRDKPDFKKVWRQVGKKSNFENLYLASPERMRLSVFEETSLLLPLDFFQGIVARRPVSRPGLWAWQQSLLESATTHSRLDLPITGHSRYFVGGAREHRNEIVNFPIQTTAGNVLLDIQALFLESSPPHEVLMFKQVYDSIWLDCPPTVPQQETQALLQAAVSACASHGYWRMLCDRHGRDIPLILETKILPIPT